MKPGYVQGLTKLARGEAIMQAAQKLRFLADSTRKAAPFGGKAYGAADIGSRDFNKTLQSTLDSLAGRPWHATGKLTKDTGRVTALEMRRNQFQKQLNGIDGSKIDPYSARHPNAIARNYENSYLTEVQTAKSLRNALSRVRQNKLLVNYEAPMPATKGYFTGRQYSAHPGSPGIEIELAKTSEYKAGFMEKWAVSSKFITKALGAIARNRGMNSRGLGTLDPAVTDRITAMLKKTRGLGQDAAGRPEDVLRRLVKGGISGDKKYTWRGTPINREYSELPNWSGPWMTGRK